MEAVTMKNLLWVDCIAGLTVGIGVLLLHGWLSQMYNLSSALVLAMGIANLLYGCYSLSLALRSKRPKNLIRGLAIANMAWGVFCVLLVIIFRDTASVFAYAVLLFEAVFVGGLGLLEWRYRKQLWTA